MEWTRADLVALLPLLVLAGAALVVTIQVAVRRSHPLAAGLTIGGLALTVASLGWTADAPHRVGPLLVMDSFSHLVLALVAATAAAVALLAFGYLRRKPELPDELYVLLLLATLGAGVLAAAVHVASLFMGLELLSVALYGLVAYPRSRPRAAEAGIKYLVVAAVGSAFLLFGAALLYAETGTLELTGMLAAAGRMTPWLAAGLALVLVALGFKLAAAPFHLWALDVYEGAPAPVTAFLATVSKAGVVAVLLRLALATGLDRSPALWGAVALLAVASILVGNLLALLQRNVKRLLAGSSIAHMGYLLVAVLAGGAVGAEAATVSLVAYVLTSVLAFGVVTVLADGDGEREVIDDYRGLLWRRPWPGAAMTLAMLSLAGIPLTAGFVGKYWLLAAGVGARAWAPVLVLVAGSVIGLFYYLRLVATMLTPLVGDEATSTAVPLPVIPVSGALVLLAAAALLLWFGVLPQLLAGPVGRAVEALA